VRTTGRHSAECAAGRAGSGDRAGRGFLRHGAGPGGAGRARPIRPGRAARAGATDGAAAPRRRTGRRRRARRAERDGGADRPSPGPGRARRAPAAAPRPEGPGRPGPDAAARGAEDRRRRLRQGRRRQVDHGGKPRRRARRRGAAGRVARCRHLRPLPPPDARHPRTAAHRGATDHPDQPLGAEGHVHRLPRRGGDGDDLARPDGDGRARAAHGPGGVGRARHHGGRHAARHRGCAAHHVAAGAAGRGRHRLDAAGRGADRRPARGEDVREGACPRARGDREHVLLLLPQMRAPGRAVRPWRRAGRGGADGRRIPRRAAAQARDPDPRRCRHPDRRRPAGDGGGAGLSPHGGPPLGQAERRGGAGRPADRHRV
ncbi:MAG: [4Fe-4S] cluster assembly scaffold protein Mrp (ApbC), partial [uncultured Craurococcus sp.]